MSFLIEQQQKANQNLENIQIQSRLEDRVLWDKLITVALGILGFSLTLFSTNVLSTKIINSSAKYFLLFSWVLYGFSLFVGFFLLKMETSFQRKESLRNTLYAMDTAELLDSQTLKVKEDKKELFIALQILRSKSIGKIDFWSEVALATYESHKKELNSYNMVENPEKLYSTNDRIIISRSEKILYGLITLATILLIISVATIII